MRGRPIGKKRRQDREHDLRAWIVDPARRAEHQRANADPPKNFACDNGCEQSRALPNENKLTHTAATAKRWKISAVASFASPSPSRITRMRREICILRAMESGATASGGATIAPNTKPTGHASPISQWAAAATATVVNKTQPRADSEKERKLNRNSHQLIATADA